MHGCTLERGPCHVRRRGGEEGVGGVHSSNSYNIATRALAD